MNNALVESLPFATAPRVGDLFPTRELVTLTGERIRLPDASRVVHLQLRRFAGCPICSLHLRSFARRHEELVAADVFEVAVFHSSREELEKVHAEQPFAVVPDPGKRLYAELGVGTSPRAMLDPRAWAAALRALVSGAATHPTAGSADGSFGLPGDFLIAPSGRLLALHRGTHADDQWSIEEVLALAREHQRAERS
jgi:peroxiredoxin